MAKARPSVQKRNKEAAKIEKLQQKAARKAARDVAREAEGGDVENGVDPDLVGIVAGPQPKSEEDDWMGER